MGDGADAATTLGSIRTADAVACRPTTVGLVGCGRWGRNILRDLRTLGCRVRVASLDPQSRVAALELGAIESRERSDELPACDGYVIATPIDALAAEALRLLPRGAPIFSEKTLCPTVADAERLDAAGAAGRVFLMHKWEYHGGVRALRDIARSGRIGELREIQCRRHGWIEPGRHPDVLTILAVHDLTIVRHILGAIPAPACAFLRHEGETPVGLLAVLGAAPRATLSVDGRHPEFSRAVTLFGTAGAARLTEPSDGQILIRDGSGEERVPFENRMPLFEELGEFVGYLRGGPAPRCGFEHARIVAEALDALRRAAGSGG